MLVKLFFRNRIIYYKIWISKCSAKYVQNLFIVIAWIARDGKEWKCPKFLRIIQSYILQTRTESLKLCIVFHDHMRCVMVCKVDFTNWNAKIALLRASMVVTYYIKLFRTGPDRHNGILMSLLLLIVETIKLRIF